MTLPLANIRVLDFSHLLPAELCSTILADLGCEVIRIERLKPGLGQKLPPIVQGESLYFWSVHRDEERIAIDLKSAQGKEVIQDLIHTADVLLENFRPGVMGRLGFGYNKLKTLHPRLVYCSISGYGQHGEFSQRPAHDINLIAESGVVHMSRDRNNEPTVPGLLVSDLTSALFASLSIVSALLERNRTNKGRHLDISMFESALWTQCLAATATLYLDQEPREASPQYRESLANYNLYACKDGRYLAAAPLEPEFWKTFCERLERPDLLSVFAFGEKERLRQDIAKTIATKPLAEWMEIFDGSDCCVSPVNSIKEALEWLPVQERNMLSFLNHPVLGKIGQLRTPLPFDRSARERFARTDLGKSTAETLKKLGYTEAQIDSLRSQGNIPAE